MSYIVLTVDFTHVAVPFTAKLAEALAVVQAQGVIVDSNYDGTFKMPRSLNPSKAPRLAVVGQIFPQDPPAEEVAQAA